MTTGDSTSKGRLFNSFPDSGGEDTELSTWNCHPLTARPIPRHPESQPTRDIGTVLIGKP